MPESIPDGPAAESVSPVKNETPSACGGDEIYARLSKVRAEIERAGTPSEKAALLLDLCRWLTRREAYNLARAHLLTNAMEGIDASGDAGRADSAARAEFDYLAGTALFEMGKTAQAKARLEAAIRCFKSFSGESSPDEWAIEARALVLMGELLHSEGDAAKAETAYSNALPLLRRLGDRVGEADCLLNLGELRLSAGRLADAKLSLNAALLIYRETGEPMGEADCLLSLANLNRREGAPPNQSPNQSFDAMRAYKTALRIYRESGDRLGEADALKNLGDVQMETGESEAAETSWRAAMESYRKIGHRLGEALCLASLGASRLALDERSEAEGFYEAALPIFREIGHRNGEAECVRNLERLRALAKRKDGS